MFTYFIPKNETIWIFGAIQGTKYMDNAKYLFEFVHKYTHIQAIWITKNKNIITLLQSKGYQAFLETSPEARYYAPRAKIAVITHRGNYTNSDLPMYLLSKETKIIQLWHGIPLKKIAYDDKIFSFHQNENNIKWKTKVLIKNIFFPFLDYVNSPSLILALSKETQDIFSKAFRIEKEKVIVTGYPRNDILLKNVSKNLQNNKIKKIVYMPTFRGTIDSNFDLLLNYGFDIEKMNDFLRSNDMYLDIKLHPFNQPSESLISQLHTSSNIFFLENDTIYETIHQYDILITDYSSVYFDYLLFDRPIIFAPFDKESYIKQEREFYFEYDEVTPGPQAKNWEEVIQYIDFFKKNKFAYQEERINLKNKFHTFQDDKSTQRVYAAILNTLQ